MKTTILFSALLLAVLSGCSDKKQEADDQLIEPEVKNEQPVVDAARECFQWVKGNDTIAMQYTRKVNNVSGELRYAWYEKDNSAGTFVGVFKGDTLRADYTFQSEGMQSIREIVFVRRENTLVQGSGEIEMKGDREIFKNPKKLTFDNSIVLTKIECPE